MSTKSDDTSIFTKVHDLMAWLTARAEKFPRSQRFLLANRLLDTAFACHEELIRARKVTGQARAQALLQADVELETLRLQWRLAHETKLFTDDRSRQKRGSGFSPGRSARQIGQTCPTPAPFSSGTPVTTGAGVTPSTRTIPCR